MSTEQQKDPGLQAERTALSWSRTALALLANALLTLKASIESQRPLLAMLCAMVLICAVSILVYARIRHRELLEHNAPAVPAKMTASAAALTSITCLLGLVTILSH